MEQPITPGTIYTIWEAVKYFTKNNKRVEKARLSSILYNVLYSVSSIKLVNFSIDWLVDNGLMIEDSEYLNLSEEIKLSFKDCHSSKDMALILLKDYVLKQKPYWLAFFSEDIDLGVSIIPQAWLDLLDTADLLNFSLSSTLDWWKEVIAKLEYTEFEDAKIIGDIGEELTVRYEKDRLQREGFVLDEGSIVWMSRFSDNFGYDVSSMAGSLNTENPCQNILIEVKSTQSSSITHYRFFISRNEWETAISNIDSYFFYFWRGVLPDNKERESRAEPIVISAKELIALVPTDQSSNCKWIDAQMILDLSNKSSFVKQ